MHNAKRCRRVASALLFASLVLVVAAPVEAQLPPGDAPLIEDMKAEYDAILVNYKGFDSLDKFPGLDPQIMADVLYHALKALGMTLAEGDRLFWIGDYNCTGLYGIEVSAGAGCRPRDVNICPRSIIEKLLGEDFDQSNPDYSALNTPAAQSALFLAVAHELHHACRHDSKVNKTVPAYNSRCEELAVMNAARSTGCDSVQAISCDR